jgi:hypothetical protein
VAGSRKEAVRAAVIEAALTARAVARELVNGFRGADRYFKLKATIVAGWVAVSLTTLFVACPPAWQGPKNALQARARVNRVAALDREITALYLENRSEVDWNEVMIKLNGIYTAALPSVRAGKSAVVQLDKFSDAEGRTPPSELRPERLEVRCSAGSATLTEL